MENDIVVENDIAMGARTRSNFIDSRKAAGRGACANVCAGIRAPVRSPIRVGVYIAFRGAGRER